MSPAASNLPSSPSFERRQHRDPRSQQPPQTPSDVSSPMSDGGFGETPEPGTLCGGCHLAIDEDQDDTVVSFGPKTFHMDCFRCSKCRNRVSADSHLLLLNDGTPVCAACSYSCAACNEPILDQAIMTGEQSYHAACFKCRSCKTQIDDLVFAKTSQGIYCMDCHNVRVARARKHADEKKKIAKRDREKDRAAERQPNGSSSSLPSGHQTYPSSPLSFQTAPSTQPSPSQFDDHSHSESPDMLSLPHSRNPTHSTTQSVDSFPSLSPSPSSKPNQSHAGGSSLDPGGLGWNRQDEFPATISGRHLLPDRDGRFPDAFRRKSADEGAGKPGHTASSSLGSEALLGLGLGVPGTTSRAERRRSINPMSYPELATKAGDRSTFGASTTLPILPLNPSRESTSSPAHAMEPRLSPLPPSPLRSSFSEQQRAHPSASLNPRSSSSERLPPTSPTKLSLSSSVQPLNFAPKRSVSRDAPAAESPSPTSPHWTGPARTSSLPDSLASPRSVSSNGTLGLPIPQPLWDRSPSPSSSSRPSRREDFLPSERAHSRYSDALEAPSPQNLEFPRQKGLPISPSSSESSFFPAESQPPTPRQGTPTRTRSPAENFAMTIRLASEDEPLLRTSVSSERGTSPTTATASTLAPIPPRQRSISAVSPEPPRLDAHRPLSFLLTDDPDFADLFQNPQPSISPSPKVSPTSEIPHRTSPTVRETPPSPPSEEARTPELRYNGFADDSATPTQSASIENGLGSPLETSESNRSLPSMSNRPIQQLSDGRADSLSPSSYMRKISSASSRFHQPLDETEGLGGPDGEAWRTLKEMVEEAKEDGKPVVSVEVEGLELVLDEVLFGKERYDELKRKYDATKRASARYAEGLTVASEDYEREVNTRREVEAEVKRLRAQLHGHTARLSLMDADTKRQDSMQRRSRELAQSMHGLEQDISKLRAERDLTLAEVEELATSAKNGNLLQAASAETGRSSPSSQPSLSRSLSVRLDTVKNQYRAELEPLMAEKESLTREIAELKDTRQAQLEESTTLHARNEELSDLQRSLAQQVETAQEIIERASRQKAFNPRLHDLNSSTSSSRTGHSMNSPSLSSLPTLSSSGTTTSDYRESSENEVAKFVKVVKPEHYEPATAVPAVVRKFRWYKPGGKDSTKNPNPMSDSSMNSSSPSLLSHAPVISAPKQALAPPTMLREIGRKGSQEGPLGNGGGGAGEKYGGSGVAHVFMSHSVQTLRFVRCEHCNDKMWGPISELRCSDCAIYCHTKCALAISNNCTSGQPHHHQSDHDVSSSALPLSMFGRSLSDQVDADDRDVPVIVEKSVQAVEKNGADFEGIYRKSGGAGLSKNIRLLFERGDYDAFDLTNQDRFNDMAAITSNLKNYFRELPDPLFTFALHESFCSAAMLRDLDQKRTAFETLIKQLPKPHYDTLRFFALHLHHLTFNEENKMSARTFGTVFGPTLMKSSDKSVEFTTGDMAGKHAAVEWVIEHAPAIFRVAES